MRKIGESLSPSAIGIPATGLANAAAPRAAATVAPVMRAPITPSTAGTSALGGKPPAAPGTTTRQFAATLAAQPAAAPAEFKTLDAAAIARLVCGITESATLEISVPVRSGIAHLPISTGEPLEIDVPHDCKATLRAEIQPSPDGPVIAAASIRFEPGFVINNLSALDHRASVSIGQHFVTATMQGISVDKQGFAKIEGTLELPLLGAEPLADHAPPLPRVETHLLRYFGGSAATVPSLPGLPAPDPHRLLLAMGAIAGEATFKLDVTGKAACTVDLDAKSPGVRTGGVGIKDDNGKLTLNACGLDGTQSLISAASLLVGNSVAVEGKFRLNASGKAHAAVTPQGDITVSAKTVTATVSTSGAKVASSRLNASLGDGAGATVNADSIELGSNGIVVTAPSGTVDLKLSNASWSFGTKPA